MGDLPAAVVVFAAPVHVQNESATDLDSNDGGTDFDYDDLDVPNLMKQHRNVLFNTFNLERSHPEGQEKAALPGMQKAPRIKEAATRLPPAYCFYGSHDIYAHTVFDAFGADDSQLLLLSR